MLNNSDLNKSNGLGFARLTAVAIGATIGGGVFSLAGDMAANGANTGAVIVGWIICGIGMLALAMCFYGLNKIKPHLTGGIYSYANEGWGDYVGFNSAWGYWISALLANVSYATLLFAAISYFIPIFGSGNNIWSIVCASLVIWFMNYLVLRGVKEAAGINLVVTISKVIPILVFIVAVIFVRAFDPCIFMQNFWGEPGGLSFIEQVKATSGTTVWAFIGIEGAVVISGRAKRSKDVGKATITAFLSVLAIYIMVSLLSMGVMPRAELAELGNPPMAGILKSVVGPWGAAIVNLGVIISLAGATLGYTIIASECPYLAAKNGVFSKIFAKENKNGAPVNSLFLTNGIIQIFLIITYLNESTYQIFYTISASMIMIPYLLSALYYLLISIRKDGFDGQSSKDINLARFIGVLGTVYGCWLIYASGLTGLLITAILYAPGTIVYVKAKKEKGEKCFESTKDKVILAALVVLAIVSLVLIFNGTINPF
ncbi:MAG: basic amino acid/polyamine antiporter [Clostridium sp.]|nr:basic amino acid/polyamine antiporter [Clostridium sp.]MDU7082377.1 basic amino acid/polyamine antiporter [Clostridium sp.]